MEFRISVEIKSIKIKDNKILNSLIEDIKIGVKEEDNFNFKSNVKAKMTNNRYFVNGKGKKNFEKIKCFLKDYNIVEAWGIVYNKGDNTVLHNHLNSNIPSGQFDISGVLYLSDGKTGTVFKDINKIEKAEKGKMILFSPHLLHYVPAVEDDERIILSFNGRKNYRNKEVLNEF